ncbi:hypothetical protein EGP99_01615 [bacterium]|jgi:hypothetical protein|nr:hypothetical protein [bacterium]
MNENIEVVTLEDGKDYMVTAELEINNIKYLFLTNEDDVADFCLRKINTINNNEYLVGLNDKEEVIKVLQEFTNKFKNE